MVKIIAWNVIGAMFSTLCLSSLLDKTNCDVAIISEHKLKNQNIGKMYLDSIHKYYLSIVKIDVNESYSEQTVCLTHVGKGGIVFLIKITCIYSERNSHRL